MHCHEGRALLSPWLGGGGTGRGTEPSAPRWGEPSPLRERGPIALHPLPGSRPAHVEAALGLLGQRWQLVGSYKSENWEGRLQSILKKFSISKFVSVLQSSFSVVFLDIQLK